jgi:hypothetical protein
MVGKNILKIKRILGSQKEENNSLNIYSKTNYERFEKHYKKHNKRLSD